MSYISVVADVVWILWVPFLIYQYMQLKKPVTEFIKQKQEWTRIPNDTYQKILDETEKVNKEVNKELKQLLYKKVQ